MNELIIGTVTTRQGVERGLYNAIRKAIVAAGYLPNEPDYGTIDLFEAAKATMRLTKELIDVKPVGTARQRGTLYVNTIFIDRYVGEQGDILGATQPIFTKYETTLDPDSNDRYLKQQSPEQSENIQYRVRYYTDDTGYDRVIEQIIKAALGHAKKSVPVINDDDTEGQNMFIIYNGDVDMSDKTWIERIFQYTCMDLRLAPLVTLDPAVLPVLEFDIDVKPMKGDGTPDI